MSLAGLKVISIRDFKGIDRTENARITNPGSWKTLKNLWAPEPGSLEQRPGSVEFASEIRIAPKVFKDSSDDDRITDMPDTGRPPVLRDYNDPGTQLPGKWTQIDAPREVPDFVSGIPSETTGQNIGRFSGGQRNDNVVFRITFT